MSPIGQSTKTASDAGGNAEIIGVIGLNIMKLRKQEGLTQMELAEKMGVSFQAVSNWERGLSCPDIERLAEISRLFNVSLDEITENRKTLASIDAARKEDAPITPADIEAAAPFLSQAQTDQAATKCCLSENDLAKVAPFVSQSFIDEFAANKVRETGDLTGIKKIAPFISTKLLDQFAEERYAAARDLHAITAIIAFISDSKLEELAKIAYEKDGIPALSCAAPFLRTTFLDALAVDALKKYGLGGLSPVLAFVSSHILEEYLKKG